MALCLAALIAALATLAGCAGPARTAPTDTVIVTGAGALRGAPLGDGGGVFLGVPFAAPPVGERRWAPPEAVEAWSGQRDATGYAPACPQGDYIVSWYADLIEAFGGDRDVAARPVSESEDCLYLNIWTPDIAPEKGLPVMVWIHGGAYRGGWSYEPNYIGERLSERGVVVVSIAYRLGPFGYLGPDGPANFGLQDQIAALEWVQENIASFGGDPGNVTVFGESAGASSIGTLIVAPRAHGLFQRAIHQSGGFEFVRDRADGDMRRAFERLAAALGPIDPRSATTRDVMNASANALADHWFAPSPDVDLLASHPADLLASGNVARVDLMIGTNRDEWLMYLDPETADVDLATWRERLPGAAPLIDAMVAEDGTLGALDRIETADQMRCPGRILARAVDGKGGRVFVYLFSRVRSAPSEPELGSYHGAEIPYVFGTHDTWLPTNDIDRNLTENMMSAWVNFARNGDPNPAVEWPAFGATGKVLELGDRIVPTAPLDDLLCPHIAAYREVLP